ncbi:PDDEXK nuclease domain-containing protein [Flavobacterium chungangense]|uniref:Nuclease YhcG n=1 Tax=Flavobacterium chungangense TaxID=554283 RepID=A0A6V6YYM0_9FLAO|nr:PDDEXK nuclease domain-containing protein [Flavobacterium chungangense]CAD0004628.1 Putative nuclease YhcG [Flavobacterium chungangense]
MIQEQFTDIIQLIKQSRSNAITAVNTEMINLYWNIGQYIQNRIETEEWGKSVVKELADFLQKSEPYLKGFSDKNLWRMKQFYQTYKAFPKLSALLREISWTNNLIILSRTKSVEEQEFYLRLSSQEKFSSRELERQINSGVFERTMIGNSKVSSVMRELHPDIKNTFKDSYIFDFLNLSDSYNESDLQKGLINQMKNFILELGKDFLFIAEEYKVQVGYSDFYIDLVFYHRGLQCLVAFELKSDKFKPEHLGQLNFYLEALDRDVKKQNENPSIGILLCKDQDHAVVEYALSRSLSPTMVAEYKIQLPDKHLLKEKLNTL